MTNAECQLAENEPVRRAKMRLNIHKYISKHFHTPPNTSGKLFLNMKMPKVIPATVCRFRPQALLPRTGWLGLESPGKSVVAADHADADKAAGFVSHAERIGKMMSKQDLRDVIEFLAELK